MSEVPFAGHHIWSWFWELDAGRSYGMTANPIEYGEIRSWASLVGAEPTDNEVRAIKAMDIAYRNTRSKLEG